MIGIYITIVWVISIIIATLINGAEGGVITFMLGGLFALMAYLGLRVALLRDAIKKRFMTYASEHNMTEEEMDWSESIVNSNFYNSQNVIFQTFSNKTESVIKMTDYGRNSANTARYYGFMKPVSVKKRLLVSQALISKMKNLTSLEQVDVSSFEKLKSYSVIGDIFDLNPLEMAIPTDLSSDVVIAFEDGYVMAFMSEGKMTNSSAEFDSLHNLVDEIVKSYKKLYKQAVTR